jgi:multiple sugar transport system substrate-binding protein
MRHGRLVDWGTPEELTRFEEFNDEFMKRHPDITVELQPVASYSDYHSKLLASSRATPRPTCSTSATTRSASSSTRRCWQPLTKLMESDASQTQPDDFFPGLFGAAEQDGEIFAAPNDSNPDVLWYDKQALAAAGITEDPATLAENGEWTTEKYLEMNDKLAAAGLTGSMFWNYWATHYSWISSQGGTAYDDSGAFVGDEDATTVDAVDTLGRYFQDGTFVVADSMPEGAGADSVFVTHKAGFFSQGRYTIGTVESAGEQDSYDIVRWPTPDGQAAPTGVATSYLAINGKTTAKDAAVHRSGPSSSRPRARCSASRAAATRSRRSRAPTRSCSRTATRPTRRRSWTCGTSASRTTPPRRSCPASPPT